MTKVLYLVRKYTKFRWDLSQPEEFVRQFNAVYRLFKEFLVVQKKLLVLHRIRWCFSCVVSRDFCQNISLIIFVISWKQKNICAISRTIYFDIYILFQYMSYLYQLLVIPSSYEEYVRQTDLPSYHYFDESLKGMSKSFT